EDRGFEVDTASDLIKGWSVEKKGERFRIKTFTGATDHGEAFIRLTDPQLRYAEVKVNDKLVIFRDGEVVRVKSSDEVKVEKVITNIENDTKEVGFQIVPARENPEVLGTKFYEIRFLRGDQVFARIPLQVEGA